MEIREDKVLSLLAKFRNDNNVNTVKSCVDQIAYNNAQPKKDFAPMQRLADEQTEALKRLLVELKNK